MGLGLGLGLRLGSGLGSGLGSSGVRVEWNPRMSQLGEDAPASELAKALAARLGAFGVGLETAFGALARGTSIGADLRARLKALGIHCPEEVWQGPRHTMPRGGMSRPSAYSALER